MKRKTSNRTVTRKFRVLSKLVFELGQPVAVYWRTDDQERPEFYAGTISRISDDSIDVEMNFGGIETIDKEDWDGISVLSKPLTKKTVYYKADVAKLRIKSVTKTTPVMNQSEEKPISKFGTLTEAMNADILTISPSDKPKFSRKGRELEKMAYDAIKMGDPNIFEKVKDYYPNTMGFIRDQIAEKADVIKLVDSKYLFKNATVSFKEWVADSVNDDNDSPFLTALKYDNAAKENGLEIAWNDSFPDEDIRPTNDYQGAVIKDSETIARIRIRDDGSSTVYKFDEGKEILRVEESGGMYLANLKTKFDQSYFTVMETLAEGATQSEEHTPDPVAVAKTDKAYKFKYATEEFKDVASDSINKDDYSLFLTAKKFDLAAKRNGCTIEWGYVADKDVVFGEYNGLVKYRGEPIGRIVIGDDGKAPIYVGKTGSTRLTYDSGRGIMINTDGYDREYDEVMVSLKSGG